MADLAIAFHWAPHHMARFTLTELMQWRELARERTEPQE